MKTILNLFVAVLFTVTVQAQFRDKDPFITKSFSEKINEVYARTSGGSIAVTGGNEQARVEVYIQGNNGKSLSNEEIKRRLDEDYKFVLEVQNGELKITAEPKDKFFNWKQALNISFNVYVPHSVSTDLSTSGGSIHMENLSGTQNFSTSGGSLHLDKLSGKVRGKTSGGSIDVKNAKDDIDLSTSGGSITAENCSGTMRLNTSGGRITLNGLRGTVDASTSGGPIHGNDIKGELVAHTSGGGVDLQDLSGSVEASTSGGNMDVEINELDKYVTIKNSGGNTRVKLPGDKGLNLNVRGENIRIDNMNNFSGSKDEHRVEGKLNGGGVPVNIQSSGNITVALN
jgi:DUF4097 and DUF4098 domain-containing protein YvlB